jgi:hypothetical protein
MQPCAAKPLRTLAAREPRGPAEMVFTRTPNFRPASKASTLVSDSRAAFAELMPPPYPAQRSIWAHALRLTLNVPHASWHLPVEDFGISCASVPGTICSEARYVRDIDAPPLFISGPKCCSIDTKEYADALTAARYPCGQARHGSAQCDG